MNIIKPSFVVLNFSKLAAKLRSFLIRLVGISPQGTFLAHVFLSEVLNTGLSLLHLLWCHALEGLHAVFVHVDGELVHEVLGLYVGSIRIQDVSITTWVQVLGLCGVHEGRYLELVVRVKVLVAGAAVVIWFNLIFRILIIMLLSLSWQCLKLYIRILHIMWRKPQLIYLICILILLKQLLIPFT